MPRRANGEGSKPTLRADGRWAAALRLPGYQRKWVYARTQAECIRKLDRLRRTVERHEPIPDDRLRLETYLADWLAAVRPNLAHASYVRYEQCVNKHILPALGKRRLAQLTPIEISRFYADRLKAGVSPSTVRYIHRTLNTALATAERWGTVPRNVARLVDPPRVPRFEGQALTAEQARQLIAGSADDRWHALYALAVTTGMREGELLGLHWADVDLDAGTLLVRYTLSRVGKTHTLAEPKTKSSRRTVYILADVVPMLKAHRQAQREWRLAHADAYEDQDLVFPNVFGGPMDAGQLLKEWYPLLERLGLPRVRFHDLRATYTTLLREAGVTLEQVSRSLGHTTTAMTLRHYSHATPAMAEREQAALARLFS